ncbi:MAG: HesA/MoeB/ThiF family protein [Maribacter sp.]|nr:HesA/MoeB/ThiF family protein [Maribacter sp.]
METERYSRQTVLKEFGHKAQAKLAQAKVLVVGAGGLGVPVLTYLNAMGVGTLGMVDADTISTSNLHRQVLYTTQDVGESKVAIASKKLRAQNPNTELLSYDTFLTKENAMDIINGYDLVIDATDNFPTRYLVNDVCVILKKPFVYGALHSFEGQISVFNYKGGPTYRCLFPDMPSAQEVPNCDENGVLGVIPGIVGNLQALEAVKVLTGIGEVLSGKLLLFNGLNQSFQKVKFSPIPANLNITMLQMEYTLNCSKETVSIEASEFEKLWNSELLQIIDVRTLKEYEQFHLRNSICHPLDGIDNWRHQINLSSPVYLICQSGIRSLKAQQYLQANNPEANFINVNGGINKLKIYATEH